MVTGATWSAVWVAPGVLSELPLAAKVMGGVGGSGGRKGVVPEVAVVAGLEAHAASHGVGGGDGEAVGETPVQLHLEAVVHRGVAGEVLVGIGGALELLIPTSTSPAT